MLLSPVCDKFTECIQCIVKCKFWYVLLQNTSHFCLWDPASSSAPVAELYNNTNNCPVPILPVDSAGLPVYVTVIGLILGLGIVGSVMWYWRLMINKLCLRRGSIGSGTRMRYYDLDREMDAIEMDPIPRRVRAELPSKDGSRVQPAILESNESIRLQLVTDSETEF